MLERWRENDNHKLVIGLVLDDSLDTNDGVQQYVLTIGRWLSTQGHTVHYICGQTNYRKLKNLHSISKNIQLQFNGNALSVPLPVKRRTIQDALRDIQFDVLHVQMPYSPFFSGRLIAWASYDVAIVGTFHVAPYSQFANLGGRLLGYCSRNGIKRFDEVVAVSEPASSMAKNTYSINTAILGNAFDFKRFSLPGPDNNTGVLKLLFFGRLVARKGCLDLLQALTRLDSDNLPLYQLTIAGDGPLRDMLEKYVVAHNLTAYVKFCGYIAEDDKAKYFSEADIAIFPSFSGESFGIVLLEAMANGRTVVLAADNPGYKSLLKDNPQVLFKARDVGALADKLSELMINPKLRQSLARTGRNIAERYDVSVIGPRLVEYYRLALHKRMS